MKYSYAIGIYALIYLLIIIFSFATAEPKGVPSNIGQVENPVKSGAEDATSTEAKDENEENGPANSSLKEETAKFGNNVSADPDHKETIKSRQAQEQNATNPLADLFQITDPSMRIAMASIYGAYQGNDQCSRKAFCMLGNYMKDMPGRDLVFLFMGNYVPAQYSLYYEIFKVAVMYGQNCNVYVCVPDAPPPDAAAAARPKGGQANANLYQNGNANNANNAANSQPISNSFPR